jgi:hypothetical protein
MRKIRIDRNKWARGLNEKGNYWKINYLWNNDTQKGCCLGHVIHQVCKCSWNKLNNIGEPEEYYRAPSLLTDKDDCEWDVTNNEFAKEAIKINDKHDFLDSVREKKLISLFRENNLELEFFN